MLSLVLREFWCQVTKLVRLAHLVSSTGLFVRELPPNNRLGERGFKLMYWIYGNSYQLE